jgi:integrase
MRVIPRSVCLLTLSVTGARSSQALRLRVEDLHDHANSKKLMMPKSAKGGGRNRSQKRLLRYSVPITTALAAKLRKAAAGRAPDALLLVRSDGRPWVNATNSFYSLDVREIVTSIGETRSG